MLSHILEIALHAFNTVLTVASTNPASHVALGLGPAGVDMWWFVLLAMGATCTGYLLWSISEGASPSPPPALPTITDGLADDTLAESFRPPIFNSVRLKDSAVKIALRVLPFLLVGSHLGFLVALFAWIYIPIVRWIFGSLSFALWWYAIWFVVCSTVVVGVFLWLMGWFPSLQPQGGFCPQEERLRQEACLVEAGYVQSVRTLSLKGVFSFVFDLGYSFVDDLRHLGDLTSIPGTISAHKVLLVIIADGHTELPALLCSLGALLLERFERTGHPSDLAESISLLRKGCHIASRKYSWASQRRATLAKALMRRFQMNGDLPDVDESIPLLRGVVERLRDNDESIYERLSDLGTALLRRFEATSSPCDLDEAISLQQKAVRLAQENDVYPAGYLNDLGNALRRRFETNGDLVDLDLAISALREAVQLSSQDHTEMYTRLSGIGNSLSRRFALWEPLAQEDTEVAQAQQEAVRLRISRHLEVNRNHPLTKFVVPALWIIRVYGHIAHSFLSVAEAARLHRLARHLGYIGLPIALPIAIMRIVAGISDDIGDIAEVSVVRATLPSPEGYGDLPTYLSNLGNALTLRFQRANEAEDIDAAVSVLQRAIQSTPEAHASRPYRLLLLGTALHQRSLSPGAHTDDTRTGLSYLKSGATSIIGPPSVRMEAARAWARALDCHPPNSTEVVEAYELATSLVSLVAGLEQTVRGRYTRLEKIAGLAREAAAAAFSLERPDKALEWLEQGRCLVWSQLNNLRTPLDDLRARKKKLAQRVAEVSRRLETFSSSKGLSQANLSLPDKVSAEEEARAHMDLAKQWEDLLAQVRSIPGFESFLLPSPCSVLMQNLPESGYVIVLNVDGRRCDALVLSATSNSTNLRHIPLTQFTLAKATKYRDGLRADLGRHQLRMRMREGDMSFVPGDDIDREERGLRLAVPKDVTLPAILQGLWVDLVKPIFDVLGISKPDAGSPATRIWWCPTGPLSFLPIHAAGVYGVPHPDSALDYAVSSYIPTIAALAHRVKNNRRISDQASGLFLTSQPNAPRAYAIPGTTKEVRAVFEQAEEARVRVVKLEGSEVTVEGCLDHMEKFSSVHLACHASQNAQDPLASRFLLHEGSLDLQTIIQRDLKNADFAFLSACQTSAGEQRLADEAVHLAAGMLAAGYRRVVATMWSIRDEFAPKIAEDYYAYIWKHREEGRDGVDGNYSAEGLHHAIQRIRRDLDGRYRTDPSLALLVWVPYVHFGL